MIKVGFTILVIVMNIIGQGLIPMEKTSSFLTEPAYAKWGRLAVETAKERYPEAEIADYLYVGKAEKGQIITETFKLWIREAEREFGVFVIIERQKSSDVVTKIDVIETPS